MLIFVQKKERLGNTSMTCIIRVLAKDSNLRPSAPKAFNSSRAALGSQAIANFLLIYS